MTKSPDSTDRIDPFHFTDSVTCNRASEHSPGLGKDFAFHLQSHPSPSWPCSSLLQRLITRKPPLRWVHQCGVSGLAEEEGWRAHPATCPIAGSDPLPMSPVTPVSLCLSPPLPTHLPRQKWWRLLGVADCWPQATSPFVLRDLPRSLL